MLSGVNRLHLLDLSDTAPPQGCSHCFPSKSTKDLTLVNILNIKYRTFLSISESNNFLVYLYEGQSDDQPYELGPKNCRNS